MAEGTQNAAPAQSPVRWRQLNNNQPEKMKMKRWADLLIGLLILGFVGLLTFQMFNFSSNFTVGQQIDSLNGVFVYYNGGVGNVSGRNTAKDGYNLGLKY